MGKNNSICIFHAHHISEAAATMVTAKICKNNGDIYLLGPLSRSMW